MEISLYQIDAFASKLFEGNPAAVCPLDELLPDEIMQSIQFSENKKMREPIWKKTGLKSHSGGKGGSVQHDCIWNFAAQNSGYNL